MAQRFIATRLPEEDAAVLDRLLRHSRESIYSLLRNFLLTYIKLADPANWQDERPPLDLLRYITSGTKGQRDAMRSAAQEEELRSMFSDIRYEKERRKP